MRCSMSYGSPRRPPCPLLIHELPVLRVHSAQKRLICQRGALGDAEHPVDLIGPEQFVASDIQTPASSMGHGLRVAQVLLALAQLLRGPSALGDFRLELRVGGFQLAGALFDDCLQVVAMLSSSASARLRSVMSMPISRMRRSRPCR